MIKIAFISAWLLLIYVLPSYAQSNPDCWKQWDYLLGTWKGEGTGKPGDGIGTFSIHKDISDKIIVRKGHTEFPPTEGKPASNHDDLMIVSLDFNGNPSKAVYFDNEGHTISYSIEYSGNEIVFTSDAIPDIPRFRLTYQKLGENMVNIIFAIAPPGTSGEFRTYLEGKSIRTE